MTLADSDAGDETRRNLVAALVEPLEQASRVEVWPGSAHEPDDLSDLPGEPWAVISDEQEIAGLVAELAGADLSARVVVPALDGVRLVALDDDGDWLTTIELVTSRWVRQTGAWGCDGLLPDPALGSLLDSIARRIRRPVWESDVAAALDEVEPVLPAAMSAAGAEHALLPEAGLTVCGLSSDGLTAGRHRFRFSGDDGQVPGRGVRRLPRDLLG